MAKMNQSKLNQMCNLIKDASNDFVSYFQYDIRNIAEWFNDYWISRFSKQVTEEISSELNIYFKNTIKLFSDLNNKIKREVRIHNSQEDVEIIRYKGFEIEKPYIGYITKLNRTLPDGKVGLLANVEDISFQINKLKSTIEKASNKLKLAITKSDAIGYWEQVSIKSNITSIERILKKDLDNLLRIIKRQENY